MANHLEIQEDSEEFSKILIEYLETIWEDIGPKKEQFIVFQAYCQATNSLRDYGALDMTLCDSIDCTNCRYIENLLTNDLKTKNEPKST